MNTRTCKACSLNKPLTDFSVNNALKDGRENKCKSCRNKDAALRWEKLKSESPEAAKEFSRLKYARTADKQKELKRKDYIENTHLYQQRNREQYSKHVIKRLMYGRTYYENNRGAIQERSRKYRLINKALLSTKSKEYRERNKDVLCERVKTAYLKNIEARRRVSREVYSRSPELFRERKRLARLKIGATDLERQKFALWRNKNPHKASLYTAKRRVTKLHASPNWDIEFDTFVYEEAVLLRNQRNSLTSILWHVDHIVPLQSKLVCGLHVANNFAVIPAKVNQAKSNRYWPGMPERD